MTHVYSSNIILFSIIIAALYILLIIIMRSIIKITTSKEFSYYQIFGRQFILNNDIMSIKWHNLHNWFHFVANLVATLFGYFWWSILIWFCWEVFDGFKPLWVSAPRGLDIKSVLRRNLLFADGFSMQDIFIFNFGACLLGLMLKTILGV